MKAMIFSPIDFKTLMAVGMLSICSLSVNAQNLEKHGNEEPDVTLHVKPGITMCDFDISSALIQSEWDQAIREVGNALYLEPLAGARPLGQWHWAFQLENNGFHVDQESGAWNNTFHHPDSTHYLTGENGRLNVPGVRFRLGITDRIDAGFYYTSAKPFGANYGFFGADLKYAMVNDTENHWALATRGSYVCDAQIKDFNIQVAALELLGSKQFFDMLTPYAGISMSWNHGREVTDEVNLANVNVLVPRGIVGVQFQWKCIDLGYEILLGDGMSQRSFKLGVSF